MSAIDETLKDIEEFFKDPKNVEDLKNYMKEESKKPVWNHLQCNIIWCEYNKPDNPDMGTITWCKKYKNGQEKLCEKECGKREWYELNLPDINIKGGDNNEISKET